MKNTVASIGASVCLVLTANAVALPQLVAPPPAELNFSKGAPGIAPFDFGDAPGGITETPPPVLPSDSTVSLWTSKLKCDPVYFKATRENREQSGVTPWYFNWLQKQANENAAEFTQVGEYKVFHKEFFGSFDFHCGIEKNGCNRYFTCEDAVKSIQATRPDLSLPEAMELGRKVYLTHHAMVNFAQWINWAHRTISNVQASSVGFTSNLISAFSLQPNAMADTMCALLEKGVNTAWNIIVSTAGPMLSWQLNTGFEATGLAEKLGENYQAHKDAVAKANQDKAAAVAAANQNKKYVFGDAKGTALSTIGSTGFSIINYIRDATESALDYHNKLRSGFYDEGTGIPGMGNAAQATGWCQALGGGIANQNAERVNALHLFITENAMATRSGLANLLDIAYNGDVHDGKAGTVLNHLMEFQDWDVDNRSASKDEQVATAAYIEYLMTGIWRNSKCYEKCTTKNLDKLCSGNSEAEKNGHRYCKDGRACQLQCWSSQRIGNHEMKFHGHDVIASPKFNLTMQDIGETSFLTYQNAGGNNMDRGEPMPRFLESMATNMEKKSNIAVPVCFSDNLEMGDIHKWTSYKHPDATRFPCTCGNWRSDQTKGFMEAIGMHNVSASYQSAVDMTPGMARETFTHFCPNNLRNLPPLTNYLAMCELGIRNPHKAGTPGHTYKNPGKGRLHLLHRVHLGTDSRCDAIKADTAEMTEGEANYWFCKKSTDAKTLFKVEYTNTHVKQAGLPAGKHTGMVLRTLKTHRTRCGEWLKKEGWRYEEKKGEAEKTSEVLEKEDLVSAKENESLEKEILKEEESMQGEESMEEVQE